MWISEDILDGVFLEMVNFWCLIFEGIILSGKKYEMVFEYVLDLLDLVELFWWFFVFEYSFFILFVMVGYIFEFVLLFDRFYINFREMLFGEYGVFYDCDFFVIL